MTGICTTIHTGDGTLRERKKSSRTRHDQHFTTPSWFPRPTKDLTHKVTGLSVLHPSHKPVRQKLSLWMGDNPPPGNTDLPLRYESSHAGICNFRRGCNLSCLSRRNVPWLSPSMTFHFGDRKRAPEVECWFLVNQSYVRRRGNEDVLFISP